MPFFFLIIFFMPVTGTYFLFKLRQSVIHSTIKELISRLTEEKKLLILKISISEEQQALVFERTRKTEFRYKGKMYDVAKTEKHEQTTWYWCVWDEEETILEQNLKKIKIKVMDAAADSENHEETLSLFLNTLFLNTDVKKDDMVVKDLAENNYFWKSNKLTRTVTPPTPPPKV